MLNKMTQTEKILALAAQKSSVRPGDIISVPVDWCMTNDATTHVSIDLFYEEVEKQKVFNPKRTIFVIDHNVPSESIKTTQVHNKMRRFAKDHGIILYDGQGVCHQLLIENHIDTGQVVVAADSHTCSYGALGAFGTGVGSTDFVAVMVTGRTWLMVPPSLRFEMTGRLPRGVTSRDLVLRVVGDLGSDGAAYKAMEYGGPALKNLTINDRIVLCNLAVEAGAKNAIVEIDDITCDFFKANRKSLNFSKDMNSDPGCEFENIIEYDLSTIEPAVVGPDFLDNYDVAANKQGTPITQGFIGSCNNGRIEDLRLAADILKGNKIQSSIKLLISPASQHVFRQAISEGLIEIFMESGALVLNPNCSVCWGGCQGLIGDGEVLVSTGTRNFKGRAGSANSAIFLASAATVAASCITGSIADPRDYLRA
jgi:3-isopropylmalate/(R)-2-methylmalate dehydratase large subunit